MRPEIEPTSAPIMDMLDVSAGDSALDGVMDPGGRNAELMRVWVLPNAEADRPQPGGAVVGGVFSSFVLPWWEPSRLGSASSAGLDGANR